MAESNASQHKYHGPFCQFGKMKDEHTHHQNYNGRHREGYTQVGEPVYLDHRGNIHPVSPHGSHKQPKYSSEGEKNAHEGRMWGNLSLSNGSSSISSSDEEGGEERGNKNKMKGGIEDKLTRNKKEVEYHTGPFYGADHNVAPYYLIEKRETKHDDMHYGRTEKEETEHNALPYGFTKKKDGEQNVTPDNGIGNELNVVPYSRTINKEGEHSVAPFENNGVPYEHPFGHTETKEGI